MAIIEGGGMHQFSFGYLLTCFEELGQVLTHHTKFERWLGLQKGDLGVSIDHDKVQLVRKIEETVEWIGPAIVKGEIEMSDLNKLLTHLKGIIYYSKDLVNYYNGIHVNTVMQDFDLKGAFKVAKEDYLTTPLSIVSEINSVANAFAIFVDTYRPLSSPVKRKVKDLDERVVPSFGYKLPDNGQFLSELYKAFNKLFHKDSSEQIFLDVFMSENLSLLELNEPIRLGSRKNRSFVYLIQKLNICFTNLDPKLFDQFTLVITVSKKHFTYHDYINADGGVKLGRPQDAKEIDRLFKQLCVSNHLDSTNASVEK